jgi:hypothetical protein
MVILFFWGAVCEGMLLCMDKGGKEIECANANANAIAIGM